MRLMTKAQERALAKHWARSAHRRGGKTAAAAVCIIPNCGRSAPAHEAFCSHHRDFPQPKRQSTPCAECHLQSTETCDICGATRLAEGHPK